MFTGLVRRAGLPARDYFLNHGIDLLDAAKRRKRVRVLFPALISTKFRWRTTESGVSERELQVVNIGDIKATFYANERLEAGEIVIKTKLNPEGDPFHYYAEEK